MAEDGKAEDAAPPDDTTFLVLSGAAVLNVKPVRDEVTAAGFTVSAEYNLDLSPDQARSVLQAGAAAAAVAAEAKAAAAPPAKGKKKGKKAAVRRCGRC